ncbi:hypothetical protein F5B19DRAFT_452383 [Rostrohypoxylon terebratum]|nr:hypothetical protein F5B19DRAFT_452383 [Rostrohypoxylon terebratum]
MMAQTVKCSNYRCGKGLSNDHMLCSGCKQARYCSKDCQKQDWKTHKSFCKHVTSNGTSSASMDCLDYYINIAPYDPKAQALATEIHLTLPNPGYPIVGSKYPNAAFDFPMRRLVRTGKDTPENIALFFGQKTTEEINLAHKENRMEALLNPPMGSPMDVMARGSKWDENCPPLNVRRPSDAEAEELRAIRQMQETIRQHMGSRGVEDVTSNDMRDILVKHFGPRWPDMMQVYQHALNSMDRNVRPPGLYD